jgi:hypothetical protein
MESRGELCGELIGDIIMKEYEKHIQEKDNRRRSLCGEDVYDFMFTCKEHASVPQRLIPCKKCMAVG